MKYCKYCNFPLKSNKSFFCSEICAEKKETQLLKELTEYKKIKTEYREMVLEMYKQGYKDFSKGGKRILVRESTKRQKLSP